MMIEKMIGLGKIVVAEVSTLYSCGTDSVAENIWTDWTTYSLQQD